jgi:hypothetical protein
MWHSFTLRFAAAARFQRRSPMAACDPPEGSAIIGALKTVSAIET